MQRKERKGRREGILPIPGTIGDLHMETVTQEDSTLMTDTGRIGERKDKIAEGKGEN